MNIENVELIFKSDNSFFSAVGETIDGENINKKLNLDIGILYKKSVMANIVTHLLNKYDLHEDKLLKKTSKALAFFILSAVAPKTTQWKFSDENDYAELKNVIKMDRGMQYFDKTDVVNSDVLKAIIKVLEIEGFLIERDDKYFIKGYYLDSLTITKPNS
jgi:hypothetical protein